MPFQAEQLYGAFVEIDLVENETCNLSLSNSVGDTCSIKYERATHRIFPFKGSAFAIISFKYWNNALYRKF